MSILLVQGLSKDNNMEHNIDTFKDLADQFENEGHYAYSSIIIGECEGETLAVFECWDQLAAFEAFLNGFTGLKGHVFQFRDSKPLADQLAEVIEKLKVEPDNYRLKEEKQTLTTHILYAQYIAGLGEGYEVLDCDSFGVQNVFSDEYTTCCHCGNILRTSPDSYNWVAPLLTDDGYVCDDCVKAGHYDEYLLDVYKNDQKALPESVDLNRLDLVVVNDKEFRNSAWYPNMSDDPTELIELFNTENIDVWFKVYPQQFAVTFDVVVKQSDLDKARELLTQ